ncbi:MAG TPA: GntR family transcriptional regulator [Candidatus Janibacter merdipullorum]|nr:GntR family transcriptional regulator [Candidatus Janibacter merdipullorum]
MSERVSPEANGRSGNVVEQVADTLREQIFSGTLAPGLRLSQADVARQLQVSRTPLREALHKLEAEGLVVTQANRGMSVAPAPLHQVEDAYALRLMVEPPMVRAIVQAIEDDALEDMRRRLEVMEDVQLGTRDFQDAHFAFHEIITGRYPKVASQMVNAQMLLIQRHQRLYFARPMALSDFTDVDRAFLQAVMQREGRAAARMMEYHLLDAALGMIHEVDPKYRLDSLLVACDGLDIDLVEREDGRHDIYWRRDYYDIALSETSNLVPRFGPGQEH